MAISTNPYQSTPMRNRCKHTCECHFVERLAMSMYVELQLICNLERYPSDVDIVWGVAVLSEKRTFLLGWVKVWSPLGFASRGCVCRLPAPQSAHAARAANPRASLPRSSSDNTIRRYKFGTFSTGKVAATVAFELRTFATAGSIFAVDSALLHNFVTFNKIS